MPHSWHHPTKQPRNRAYSTDTRLNLAQLSPDATVLLTSSNINIATARMSRPGSVPPRNLTLTEELEKLEQSITLTLQG